MTEESRLTNLFLKRNFLRLPPSTASCPWQRCNIRKNTSRYSCQGRLALALDSEDLATGAMPKCDSLPSQDFNPCSISRKLCARPSWQNSIDTNCCQQLTPRACRSALSLRTSPSKSLRGINLRIWLNRLQNGLTLSLLVMGRNGLVTANLTRGGSTPF